MNRKRTGLTALSVIALAGLVAVGGVVPAAAGASKARSQAACETPLLAQAGRAAEVLAKNASAFTKAAAVNGKSTAGLSTVARQDDTLWLDECGMAFYRDPVHAPDAHGTESAQASEGETALRPLSETFELESRPGSQRTIYLDFLGETVVDSAWAPGATIVAAPYTIDGDTSTFSDAERREIQAVWQAVAEDYAPFNVNVTTKEPAPGAIERTSSADLVYGTRAVISADPGGLQTNCGCGGVAYGGVFSRSGDHEYYQPAWIFTKGVGTGGKNIAEAASHEVGHNFGLGHDGTPTSGYSTGSAPWAPIMGVGYYEPITQWSRGEYGGANNTQDDLAIIANGAPLMTDDHGDLAAPTALAPGSPANGLISTRADTDVFRFTGSGATTVAVAPADGFPNLDVSLSIRDQAGTVVATVDPAAGKISGSVASGLAAVWTGTLPAEGATYTATIDGVGTGDPLTAGKYSDYASLGRYQVSLTTGTVQPPADPLTIAAGTPAAGVVGTPYSADLAEAAGGVAPYAFSATGLPAGLALDSATGVATGVPTAAGTFDVGVSVSDSALSGAGTTVRIVINPAATPAVVVAPQSLDAKVGKYKSLTLTATGGTGTYVWSVGSGTVPAGMALSSTGVLSGTPTEAGTFTFGARATSGTASAVGTVTVKVTRTGKATSSQSGWYSFLQWAWADSSSWETSSAWTTSSRSSSSASTIWYRTFTLTSR